MIRAEVICDSISPQAIRLLTFKLRYPWFIHGELMTHRVLSRNASSNRAIPLSKMLEEARSDDLRAEPVFWGAEQKGMEPGGELSDAGAFSKRDAAKYEWRRAALQAVASAEALGSLGLHKSLCNRLLMPFTHANVIVSATEWDNFFGLRLDRAADPTMRALAVAMWEAKEASTPRLLQPGEWHLPFVSLEDCDTGGIYSEEDAIKVSVARVSYESFETGRRSTVEEDLKLYDRLVGAQPLHASPAEHQATPDEPDTYNINIPEPTEEQKAQRYMPMTIDIKMKHPEQWGNFRGWRQYRQILPGQAVAPLPQEYR